MQVWCRIDSFEYEDFDFISQEYLWVYLDVNGKATHVEFSGSTCPATSPLLTTSASVESRYCHGPGRECDYYVNRNEPDFELRRKDRCVCSFGRWKCESFPVCPVLSGDVDVISFYETRSCRNHGQECRHVRDSSDRMTLVSYNCTCTLDKWDCAATQACPEDSPSLLRELGIPLGDCDYPGQECIYFGYHDPLPPDDLPTCPDIKETCTCKGPYWVCSSGVNDCSSPKTSGLG